MSDDPELPSEPRHTDVVLPWPARAVLAVLGGALWVLGILWFTGGDTVLGGIAGLVGGALLLAAITGASFLQALVDGTSWLP